MTNAEKAIHYLQSHGKKTMYVPKSVVDLSGADIPSSGFGGNLTGMRNKYWGHTCLVARQSGYLYKLT